MFLHQVKKKKSRAKKFVRVEVKFDKKTDKKLIERLDMVSNKSDYIRNLIKQDIKLQKKKGVI
ncbi:MAG: hypothetical protein KBT35_01330 [Firmicutes bacterium]|nr:hypothetical protein [Candidatus Colivicinus equi]